MRLRHYALLLLVACVAACPGAAQGDASRLLTIYAATSLTDAFEELRDAFILDYPEVRILLNFASSSTLAAQITQGAPADIFASANETQMTNVVEYGRIDEEAIEIFAHNQLVLIAPVGNPAAIASIADLAAESLLLVLAAQGTPIRAYTDAMLLSHHADNGEDFSARVLRNLVSEESNVRQVVARVALGEADAGIVYQSDVIGDVRDQLTSIAIDPRHNQLASYPIAALSDSPRADLASAFIEFVKLADAQAILTAYGFCSPDILFDVLQSDVTPEPTPDAADERKAETQACPAISNPGG